MKKLIELEGVKMQEHERDSILRLRKLGFDARPILPPGTIGAPDVVIGNQLWEIKSPNGGSHKETIAQQFRRAKKQSSYMILDCARVKLTDNFVVKEACRQLHSPRNRHSIRKVKIITKTQKII
ncbi:hypothetical protein FWG76_00680, partial [Candidatus Saccharibacteria bacterium]|nr:hypothetical protein [Candidatus Saccharibacteria bacterium]